QLQSCCSCSVGSGGGLADAGLTRRRDGGVEVGERWILAKLDGLAGAGVDGAGICAGEDGLADDMRDQQEDDLVLGGLLVIGGEEVFEEGKLAEARGSG